MTPERLDGIRQHIAKVGRCSACWTNIPDLLAHVDALTAERDVLSDAYEVVKITLSTVARQRDEARAERDVLRAALPDPSKLVLLADWIDLKYPNDSNPEVQDDLRAWARQIMAASSTGTGAAGGGEEDS